MDDESPYRLVLSTCPDEPAAASLAERLVAAGLAACVSIVPGVRSVYRWQGHTETSGEVLLLIKTRQEAYPALEDLLRRHHPYELPEIIRVPIDAGLPAYLAWIDSLVAPHA
jgi:periplasmic divalent cation tolerance protein